MTLQASGQISFNDIRIELGVGSQSPFSLESASLGLYAAINTDSPSFPDGTAPYLISDWYGYNHSAPPPCTEHSLGYDVSDQPTACAAAATPATYYSDCVTLANSCGLYTDSGCSLTATDGYYSDGVNSWFSTSGVLGSEATCNQ